MKPSRLFRVTRAFVILVILSGFGMLLYPVFANWYNDHYTSRIVSDYQTHVDTLSESAVAEMFAAADSFNSELLHTAGRWEFDDSNRRKYEQVLDVSGTGMIGTLFIPKIHAVVPFYHGDSDTVLQVAAGHMEGSSFPIEGETSHAVISAHTGMASLELFTRLDQMETGDRFAIQILNKQYVYLVTEMHVVLPDEMDYLGFQDKRNLVTLLTCTPLGVNSHRLLVTGELISVTEASGDVVPSDVLDILPSIWILYASMLLSLYVLCLLGFYKKALECESYELFV